jgi:SAM-dependent methyltransferase
MDDTRGDSKNDPNLNTYNSAEVAAHYAALDYLTPCERLLFETYLKPGMEILDLGVGGGRTAGYLSSIASRYVGVDYASEMIEACRKRFPHLRFEVGDAADLSRFDEASFDAVAMAFNGIDYLFPNESRLRMLRETRRVLKPAGIFIFSSHNPRAILVRPAWDAQRVRMLAERVAPEGSVWFGTVLLLLTALRRVFAVLQSMFRTFNRTFQILPTRAFWRDEGYWLDPVHGGFKTHLATPESVILEVKAVGFDLLRILGDDYPRTSGVFVTDWFYYVFSKLPKEK